MRLTARVCARAQYTPPAQCHNGLALLGLELGIQSCSLVARPTLHGLCPSQNTVSGTHRVSNVDVAEEGWVRAFGVYVCTCMDASTASFTCACMNSLRNNVR